MKIEIKKIKMDDFSEDLTGDDKQLFSFKWKGVTPAGFAVISEKFFFNFDIDIQYKRDTDRNKMVLAGEYNDKFWFFKILRKKANEPFSFEVKKPAIEKVHEIRISVIDWYNVITRFIPKDLEIEYAVAREE